MVLRFCLLILIGAIATTATAEIYKWVGEDGAIHFTDSPPEAVKTDKVDIQINSFTDSNVRPYQYNPDLITKRKTSKDVVMYGAAWCGVCKTAKKYFRKNRIPYKEYDVEKSSKGKADYKSLRGRGVPIILVGNQRMNGFSASGFERMYR